MLNKYALEISSERNSFLKFENNKLDLNSTIFYSSMLRNIQLRKKNTTKYLFLFSKKKA